MENTDPIKVLDKPQIRQVLFYPVKMPDDLKSDPRNLFFEVEPGVKIGCRFYQADRIYPTILFFHGNGEVSYDYDDIAPIFNLKKMNIIVADYRGYGHSDGRPGIANILKDAGLLHGSVRKMLKEQKFTGKLFIMGRSLGSLCAIELASTDKSIPGLIVESGSATNFRNYLALYGLIPYDHPVWQEGRNFFNKEKIRSIAMPTLIIHGEQDSLIPASEADILFENSGAKNKKLVIIPGADHNTVMFTDGELYFNNIARFVESN